MEKRYSDIHFKPSGNNQTKKRKKEKESTFEEIRLTEGSEGTGVNHGVSVSHAVMSNCLQPPRL